MIYDVKAEYYQTFLSTKQGSRSTKAKPSTAAPSTRPAADVMDTED